MGLFSSKKKTTPAAPNKNTVKAVEEVADEIKEIEEVEDTENVSEILKIVRGKCEGGKFFDGCLYYLNKELKVSGEVVKTKEQNGVFSAQLSFKLEHKWFDETITENVVGVGKDEKLAIENAAGMFAQGTLNFVIIALEEKGENFIETELLGKKHIFRKPSSYGVAKIGCENTNSKELFAIIEDDIVKYLGTKKVYWIRLYVACSENKAVAEVRVNNVHCVTLSQKLGEYAKSWSDTEKYHSEREFVLLVQKDETYEECPYTREIAMRFTKRTIETLKEVTDKESHQAAYEKLKTLTSWQPLNVELAAFVPEIYCECIMKISHVDYVVAMLPNGEKIEIRKTQLRSYSYMANAIINYIKKTKPSQQESFKIIRLSSTGEAINKAVQKGEKQEDLVVTTGYRIDDNYVIW